MVGENQINVPMNGDGVLKQGYIDGSDIRHNWSKDIHIEQDGKSAGKLSKTERLNAKPGQVASEPLPPASLLVDENNFFMDPIKSIQKPVEAMERLVHLDFKGAVPSLKYLKEVLPLFETLGATGLLVEYEDMFPFSGFLEPLKAANAFTTDQLEEFLLTAKKYNLKVMPLIQTFGHMEFVLKSAFPELRESSFTPQVTNNASYQVISAMVKQVLDAHPDVSHLHIGCDEVYELGKGASATVMQENKLTVGQMFLRHVKKVAHLISGYKARKIVPVMWDDMLRKISAEDIASSSLPNEVEIMVWNYAQNVSEYVKEDNFEKYGKLFGSVWIASSFKGATGSRQFYTEPLHHIKNHFSWLEVIRKHQGSLRFKGVALTGWQRYDHFATLCELLPVALPSLAVCLATIKNAGFTKEIYQYTSEILKCDDNIEMTFPKIDKKTKQAVITQDCRFPGSDIYYAMQGFYAYTQISTQHRMDGWLSDYQLSHRFSNPGQLKVLAMDLNKKNNGYTKSTGPLKLHLSSIFSPEDVEEWLEENIYERKRHNAEILDKVNDMLKTKTWPKRPLEVIQVGKPRISQQSVSNFSKNAFDPKIQKVSRFDTVGVSGGSVKETLNVQEASKIRSARISNVDKHDSPARLPQTYRQHDPKVNGGIKSDLGTSRHTYDSRAGDNSRVRENKRAFSGRSGGDYKFSAKDVDLKHGVDNSHVMLPINKDNDRIRQADLRNPFDKSEVKTFDAGYQDKRGWPVERNINQEMLGLKSKLQENQMYKQGANGGSIVQPPQYHKEVEANSFLDGTSLNKRGEFQSVAKNRQSNVKAQQSDFHDAKMKLYEDRLLKEPAS
ncbi:hypothetical protein EGW08_023522 [Elysia chlorotica]|uniref:beta-N-acetylhexosaminidase n=1 Tax=Elysia chlorotica TaxID=188477 RepID=A0A3S1AUL3_ELYCH|nr:hypothetical protein EGW08_023522 [Elysia chlorotica]